MGNLNTEKYPPAYINGLQIRGIDNEIFKLTPGCCLVKDILYTLKNKILYTYKAIVLGTHYLYFIAEESVPDNPIFRFYIQTPVKHDVLDMMHYPKQSDNRLIGLIDNRYSLVDEPKIYEFIQT